jgi:hypothetical protein
MLFLSGPLPALVMKMRFASGELANELWSEVVWLFRFESSICHGPIIGPDV